MSNELDSSLRSIFSSPTCSCHHTARISKNIIMWLELAGAKAVGSGKTIVCSWATRKKELRVSKDQFVLLSCQDFSGMEVYWQPQNYFTFPALGFFNLLFLLCPSGKSGKNTPKESWLQHLLVVWMWRIYFSSLPLGFCICKMGIMTYLMGLLWGLNYLHVSSL